MTYTFNSEGRGGPGVHSECQSCVVRQHSADSTEPPCILYRARSWRNHYIRLESSGESGTVINSSYHNWGLLANKLFTLNNTSSFTVSLASVPHFLTFFSSYSILCFVQAAASLCWLKATPPHCTKVTHPLSCTLPASQRKHLHNCAYFLINQSISYSVQRYLIPGLPHTLLKKRITH